MERLTPGIVVAWLRRTARAAQRTRMHEIAEFLNAAADPIDRAYLHNLT